MKMIEAIFQELKISASNIQAIGNHELNRHKVYDFTESNITKIIKIYYKPNRQHSELQAFELLKPSNLPIPRILDYGILSDSSEYIIMSALSGTIMDKTEIEYENGLRLYEQLGDMLGRMHSIKSTNLKIDVKSKADSCVKCAKDIIVELPLESDVRALLDEAFLEYDQLNNRIDFTNINIGFCHNDFDARNILISNDEITGLIDFEISGFGYTENDLINLHRKVFSVSKEIEEAFFKGYSRQILFDMKSYKERRRINLIRDIVENCSWAFVQAPKYFDENIEYLKRLMSEETDCD